jgi:hypothetical protein
MKKYFIAGLVILVIIAVLAIALPNLGVRMPTTAPKAEVKSAEDQSYSLVEDEMNQALSNLSEQDVENALGTSTQ